MDTDLDAVIASTWIAGAAYAVVFILAAQRFPIVTGKSNPTGWDLLLDGITFGFFCAAAAFMAGLVALSDDLARGYALSMVVLLGAAIIPLALGTTFAIVLLALRTCRFVRRRRSEPGC
jgi:hypothetical protein